MPKGSRSPRQGARQKAFTEMAKDERRKPPSIYRSEKARKAIKRVQHGAKTRRDTVARTGEKFKYNPSK